MTDLLPLDPFEHMRARGTRPGMPTCEVPLDVAVGVYERDRNACRYCGFAPGDRISGRLSLHHRDHDHGNHAPENLAVACLHCHGVHHAGFWAARGQARLLLLPEMTQAELSILSRAMAVSSYAPPSYDRDKGRSATLKEMFLGRGAAVAAFERRAAEAVKALGTDDPGVLHSCLDMVPDQLDLRGRLAPYRIWLSPCSAEQDGSGEVGLTPDHVGQWLLRGEPYGWLRDGPGRAA
jgi:hypothetical protein